MKIVTILGARPQFIKSSVVSKALSEHGAFDEVVIHTGQHFDHNMSQIFFDEMMIPQPTYNLGINSLSHGAMTGRMLEAIEQILLKEKPQVVLVYGDTNSTLAGALAAQKLGIKIAHVEAGLRSFDMNMPEEVNRILTDRISDVLFCPTQTAIENLTSEGYGNFNATILNVGDVMYDAALYYSNAELFKASMPTNLPEKYVLCTIHRQENTDNLVRLQNIVQAIEEINTSIPVVIPIHPRTLKLLETNNLLFTSAIMVPPVGYLTMLQLIKGSQMVLTDSGGLQKEAFFFQKPCITLRETTEWTELVDAKANVLVGSDKKAIVSAFESFNTKAVIENLNIYGDGNAAQKIATHLSNLN